jgi:hypothetical protein
LSFKRAYNLEKPIFLARFSACASMGRKLIKLLIIANTDESRWS